jgi:hypothetical protein
MQEANSQSTQKQKPIHLNRKHLLHKMKKKYTPQEQENQEQQQEE